MKVSQRAQSITPFLAMEFGKHAAELEAAGHRVIKLNLGEPDFGAPPTVLAELQRVASQCNLPYTGALGLPALREAIASFYQSQHGVHVGPERIVVTAGASAALLLVTAALVDPGDEVLVGDPSYPCNRQFLSGFGANVRLVPTDAASRFQLDLAAVQRHWSARTRGLMLATPSNPTGTSVPAAELAAICDWAQRHGAWRLIDEIYLNLSDADAQGRPAQTVLVVDPEVIVINSFSKYFGMTGWCLGWAVVPDALVPVMERLADRLAEGLRDGDRLVSPMTLGNHVDHSLVRRAAEQAASSKPVSLWYYADYPYAVRSGGEMQGKLGTGWRKACFTVTDEGLSAWQDAIACYQSQISTFWGGHKEMRSAIKQYWQAGGGTCLWQSDLTGTGGV